MSDKHFETVCRLANPLLEMAQDQGYDEPIAIAEHWRDALVDMVETAGIHNLPPVLHEMTAISHTVLRCLLGARRDD